MTGYKYLKQFNDLLNAMYTIDIYIYIAFELSLNLYQM